MNNLDKEKIKSEISSLRNEMIKGFNKILETLDYPIESLFLGTDLEYIYPYLITGGVKLDFKSAEKYLSNPASHSVRFFIENYIEPIRSRYGDLVCPLPQDNVIGIHNHFSFTENCINDLILYYLSTHKENFEKFINEFFEQVLNTSQLKRKYNIGQNAESLNLDDSEKLKRDTIILYLKQLGKI